MAQRANPETPGERGSVQALVKQVPRGLFYAQVQDESNEDSILFFQNNYTARASATKEIVAHFLEFLHLDPHDKLLIIGAKGGYLEFLAAMLCAEVHVIDVNADVVSITNRNLKAGMKRAAEELGIKVTGLHVTQYKDLLKGYPEKGPWHKILVSAAVPDIPGELLDQLQEGGLLVAPIIRSEKSQAMVVYEKQGGQVTTKDVLQVSFGALDLRWGDAAAGTTATPVAPATTSRTSPQSKPKPSAQPQVDPQVAAAAQKQHSQQLLEKFGKIMKITAKVKLAMVATSLKLSPEDLFEYLVEWGNEQIPFKIEDDVIIVDNVSDFTQTLDRKFQE